MGYLKSPSDMEKDFRLLPLEHHADDKFIWTFTSKEFPMDHVSFYTLVIGSQIDLENFYFFQLIWNGM